MSSTTDKATAGQSVDHGPASDTARQMGAPMIVLWAAALASLALLVGAGVTRFRTPRDVSVHWRTFEPIERVAASEAQLSNSEERVSGGAMLAAHSKTLASLGATLEAPGFGDLGSTRRLERDEIVPINRRWQITFAPGSTEGQYAQQLAVLGVELGVLAADGTLQYVAGLGDTGAVRRSGARQDDQRPYWTWERGDLQRADQVLLEHAGLPVTDEIVLHFLSPETIEKLEQLEQDFQKREPQDIMVTRFSLKNTFRGYEVFVAEQIER